MGDKKTILIISSVIILAGAIGGAAVYFSMNYRAMKAQLQEQKSQADTLSEQNLATDDDEEQLIGGQTDDHDCLVPAGYLWCPSTGKCQRMWEEYCEEYKDQYRQDETTSAEEEDGGQAVGDEGENPPDLTNDWPQFASKEEKFKFKYPDKYKTVDDNYGWPRAVVHLLNKSGGQAYDVTFEVWDDEHGAVAEGRNSSANAFFGMSENVQTGKYISITCWNQDVVADCENIYATLTFQ